MIHSGERFTLGNKEATRRMLLADVKTKCLISATALPYTYFIVYEARYMTSAEYACIINNLRLFEWIRRERNLLNSKLVDIYALGRLQLY